MGDLDKVAAPLVRLHSSCFTGDLLDSLRCDCGDQLHMALEMIASEGAGVLVYLPQEGRGIGLDRKDQGLRACKTRGSTPSKPTRPSASRPTCATTASASRCSKTSASAACACSTNNPKKTDAFIYGGFDLEVVDQVPILPPIHEHNARYLATKRDKLGHHFPADK